MLSRVAERIYWMARYIERAENTARMVLVHSNLMLDLPKRIDLTWYRLIEITRGERLYEKLYETRSESSVMQMLLAEGENPASLLSSVRFALENVRTSRDILPREAWLLINQLSTLVKSRIEDVKTRSKRNQLMEEVIQCCQALSGMFSGSLSDDETNAFLLLGRNIERVDMTSRILDEGGFFLECDDREGVVKAYENVLWANILRSVGGYLMYRQHVRMQIDAGGVVAFLFADPRFPRSILRALRNIQSTLERLPANHQIEAHLKALCHSVQEQTEDLAKNPHHLHTHIDTLQEALIVLNDHIYEAWFMPRHKA